MKETKTIEVYNESWPDLPTKPKEFIEFWRKKFFLVPKEFRNKIEINIDANSSFGDPVLEVSVSYTRPETDGEEKQREFQKQIEQQDKENTERQLLKKLKEKYDKE